MSQTTAFLELKYGWIYGGSPKFHVVTEIAVIIHNPSHSNILVFSKQVRGNNKLVISHSETDDNGVTLRRHIEVLDTATWTTFDYNPEFQLSPKFAKGIVAKSYATHQIVKNFMVGVLLKFKPQRLVIFGGRRDVLLCEKAGVKFHPSIQIIDTQEELKKQTDHLFSLNKISNIIKFEVHNNRISSLNQEFYLPRHIIQSMLPHSANVDVARQFLSHMEFENHQLNLLMKAQLHLQKIEQQTPADPSGTK